MRIFTKTTFASILLVVAANACVSVDIDQVEQSEQTAKPTFLAESPEAPLTWWVSNNFRVIDGAREQGRFERDLALFLEAAKKWSDREAKAWIFPNFLYEDLVQNHPDENVEIDYATVYDKQQHSYAGGDPKLKWALDTKRQIHLRWPGKTGICAYEISSPTRSDQNALEFEAECDLKSSKDLDRTAYCDQDNIQSWEQSTQRIGPSNPACVEVDLSTSYEARITALDTGEVLSIPDIKVEDKLIIAMGDSFSSGEGNPHMQWTLRNGSRPTMWWDERCHRSLLSGPSLASVLYARLNRQSSVTFMHYGCSGASVDDGLLRPWPLQETSEQRQRVHSTWFYRLLGYDPDPDQIPRCVGGAEEGKGLTTHSDCYRLATGQKLESRQYADILPSQVSLAAHDLSASSTTPTGSSSVDTLSRRPDALILSIGGNDVGFQELVGGIVFDGLRTYDFKPCEFRELEDESDENCLDNRAFTRLDHARFKQAAAIKRAFLNCIFSQLDLGRPLSQCETALPNEHFSASKKIELIEATQTLLDLKRGSGASLAKDDIARTHFIIGAMIRVAITIPSQYTELERQVSKSLDPAKVVVTLYPDPVMYRELDKDGNQVSGFLPCHDAPLDGRPGMIPGIFGSLDFFGLGASKADVRAADKYVLGELNGTISEAINGLGKNSWNTVNGDAFSDLTRPFGFCSVEGRFMNTITDSFFIQGLAGTSPELPLGNVAVGDEKYEWNLIDQRYEPFAGTENNPSSISELKDRNGDSAFSGPAILDRQPNFLPREPKTRFWPSNTLRRKNAFRGTRRYPSKLSAPAAFPPRGTFHPTVLGHCAYAAAILEQLLNDDEKWNDFRLTHAWETTSNTKGWRKSFLYDRICSAETLGWSFNAK